MAALTSDHSPVALVPSLITFPEITPVPSPEWLKRKPDATYRVPGTTVRLLSNPSKMPGYGWSMPAGKMGCPFRADSHTLRAFIAAIADPAERDAYEHSLVCNSCYARQGKYTVTNVAHAQQVRFEWAMTSLRLKDGEFVRHMIAAIRKDCLSPRKSAAYRWFRIHDAADFVSVVYVNAWIEIARALPEIHFWSPTRSYRAGGRLLDALIRLHAEPNVTISPSGLTIDGEIPVVPGLAGGSTVTTLHADATCGAWKRHGHCGPCRACWTDADRSYGLHGHDLTGKIAAADQSPVTFNRAAFEEGINRPYDIAAQYDPDPFTARPILIQFTGIPNSDTGSLID